MRAEYPLVVIGGGPAGIAAAVRAAQHGVRVALLDDQPQSQELHDGHRGRGTDHALAAQGNA